MRRPHSTTTAVTFALAALLFATPVVRAQLGTEAEYSSARQLLESHQYDQAVEAYGAIAHRADEARAWLGLAVATNLAGEPTMAAAHVERALGRRDDVWLARNRETVENYARQFWPLVGRLLITTDIEGVDIVVDGVSVGTTPLPLAGILVASGERRVELRSTTHEDQTFLIRVVASDYEITPDIQMTRRSVHMTPRPVRIVAFVALTTNVEGAAIYVDEQYIGTAPLDGPIEVQPGARRVTVRATGYDDGYQVVEAAGHPVGELSTPARISIDLTRTRVAGNTSSGVSNAARYSILGVGGALVAGAGVTSGLWAAAHSDLDAYCSDGVCTDTADFRSARSRFRTLRVASIVVGGVGVAMIVTSLLLPHARRADLHPDVACDGVGCTAHVSGRF